jgi:hypothetical protein
MALFTADGLRNRVYSEFSKRDSLHEDSSQEAHKILRKAINEQRVFSASDKIYDIFLSHSSSDASLVTGLKLELEDLGYSVYVDWIEDPKLNREYVTKETAKVLRARMKNSNSLIYAFSEKAAESRWMPWELGYFDGLKHKAAVLPICETEKQDYSGTEFVGIYNYIEKSPSTFSLNDYLWVHESRDIYVRYDHWIKSDKQPYKHSTV